MAAMTSGLLMALTLCVLAASVSGYTNPVISPSVVTDEYGNSADQSSQISWASLPAGKPYKHTGPPEENLLVKGFLKVVRGFTHILQPGELPYDMLAGLLDGTANIMANVKDLAFYFAGFGVCIVVGILFMIIMPIMCCCFCCCRMCNNCGGKRTRPNPDTKTKCRCVTFTIILFIVIANIVVGATLVYMMDARMTSSIDHMANATTNNLDDVGTFLDNMVEELTYCAEEGFEFTGNVVKRDLDNIGAIFGVAVKAEFNRRAGVDAAVDSIIDMDNKMDVSEEDLSAMNSSQVAFEADLDNVNAELSAVDTELQTIRGNAECKPSCQTAIDNAVWVAGVDKTNLPDITANLLSIRSLQAQDLSQSAIDGKKDFDEIPDQITTDTEQNVKDLKTMIDDFQVTVSDSLSQMDAVTSGQETLDSQAETLTEYTGLMDDYNTPRSYAFLGLSAFIWSICLMFLVGMLLGCVGYKQDDDPSHRSGTSNCGGQCLMAGVGFCFIFSWVFMLLVTLPFMIGAPLDRFLCEPLMDPDLKIFKELLDKPDGPLGEGYFFGGMLLGDNTIPLTISGVLINCQNDTAAYQALMLEHLFDISTLTDYKSEMDIEGEIANMDSDMSGIQVMSDETRQILEDFKVALDIDYNAYQTELAKDLGAAGFKTTATDLKAAAGDVSTTDANVIAVLNSAAAALESIAEDLIPDCEDKQTQLLTDVNDAEQSSSDVPDAIDDVIAATEATEAFIQTNGSYVVQEQASAYGGRILSTIDQFVTFIVNKLNTDIGGCLPLWNVWESLIHDSICNSVVLTLNGFWFGLGWCVFFMVLAIIFGVRLAKYLRKMDPHNNKVGPAPESDTEMTAVEKPNDAPFVISSPPPAYSSSPGKPPPPTFAAESW